MPVMVSAGAAAAVVILLALWWWRHSHRRSPLLEVEVFSTARKVTSRWADDPSSSPAPVKPLMKGQHDEPEEPPAAPKG